MLREPEEVTISETGQVTLPLGLLAQAGVSPGTPVVAYSTGDGRIVLRRHEDAVRELIEQGRLD
ncbi:AbrB/MazE/SpoVT family DNA-binding domain-containing protein [Streptomyces sp. SBST2-5]|uniref:SpoVT-AbrB domain-containing protein n=2 Tax=Streptomyces TaxID=1883 RepID=A0ABN1HIB4_9ACTN|nr:AbrB/MazE/SpoVT family DNA-binding domain-containing protein [Streptomyces composti]